MQGDLTYFRKNAVSYYGVFCDEFDKVNPYSDKLTDVRKKYYESHLHTQKDKFKMRVDGEYYRYQYVLNEDMPLRWKVFTDTHIVEKVAVSGDESYRVEIRDRSGKILKKCIYFGSYHNWVKTKYYVYGQEAPAVQLALWNANGLEVILKYVNGEKEKPEILYPCTVVTDKELLKKLTDRLGVPSVSSVCSKGFVYFANENISAQWNKFCANPELLDIPLAGNTVQDTEQAMPVKTEEKPKEEVKPRKKIDLTQTQDVIVPNVVKPDSVVIHSTLHTPDESKIEISENSSENHENEDTATVVRSRPFGMNPSGVVLDKENDSEDEPTEEMLDNEPLQMKLHSDSLIDYTEKSVDPQDEKEEEQNTKNAKNIDVFEYLSDDDEELEETDKSDESDDLESLEDSEQVITLDLDMDFDDEDFDEDELSSDILTEDLSKSPTQEFTSLRGYEVKKVRHNPDADRKKILEKERNKNIAKRAEMKTLDDVKRAYENMGAKSDDAADGEFNPTPFRYAVEPNKNVVPIDKIIKVSDDEVYNYFGGLNADNKRDGRGRTVMKNGCTAYDGGYSNDMRSGFGVYYFRTGKICYVGDWENNRRNGVGISFNHNDRSMLVGSWENDCPTGMCAQFDKNGSFSFAGRWESGSREGVGVLYTPESGGVFVSSWENDVLSDKGTVFDSKGNLVYNGSWKKGARNGKGTQYDRNGLVVYSGEWKNNKYNGQGTLNLPNGCKIVGEFEMGKIHGYAVVTNKKGKKLYEGEWKNNRYDGQGKLFNTRDGSWCEGNFSKGEHVGILSGYSKDGVLLYTGEWRENKFHGKGISYENGEKVYEGQWVGGIKSGSGKEFSDGKCVYIGGFENNMRNGFGTSFNADGSVEYSGLWTDGYYDGVGLLYASGEPRYAGSFIMGTLSGRVNVISNGIVVKECIYTNGECVYMREYTDDGLTLKYDGHVKKGLYEGMGCGFSAYGEKYFEGIFKKNEPFKNMKVSLRKLEKLEYCEEVSESDYNEYISGPDYVVEQAYNGGAFSGLLVDGKPEGKGTILYSDHGYTGAFSGGIACGIGVIYEWDGSEITGTFVKYAGENTTEITLANGVTYHLQNV